MKPLFKIREIAWAIVSEVEDWLYPYHTDATEPLWAENNDPTDDSVVTYLKAQSDANNDRIDRLQSEMLYVTSQINYMFLRIMLIKYQSFQIMFHILLQNIHKMMKE